MFYEIFNLRFSDHTWLWVSVVTEKNKGPTASDLVHTSYANAWIIKHSYKKDFSDFEESDFWDLRNNYLLELTTVK